MQKNYNFDHKASDPPLFVTKTAKVIKESIVFLGGEGVPLGRIKADVHFKFFI